MNIVSDFDKLISKDIQANVWFLLNSLLDLFAASPKKSSEKQSELFPSLDFFLTKLALGDISAAAQCCGTADESSVYTPHEKEEYNRYISHSTNLPTYHPTYLPTHPPTTHLRT